MPGDAVNEWISLLVSWLPFLSPIGAWLYFFRYHRMQAGVSSRASMIELYKQQVAETRRMIGYVERIVAALEKREGGRCANLGDTEA